MRPLLLTACIACLASTATAAELSQDAVRDAVHDAARRSLPDTVVDIEVRSLKVYGDADVPAGATPELRVLSRGDWLGRLRLDVEVSHEGDLLGTVTASVDVVGYIEIPVLRRSAGKGTTLRPEHLALLQRPLDSVPAGAAQTLDELLGRSVKRDLRLGAVVREADLAERVDAERGRPVTVRLRTGSLLISVHGVLDEDAGIGNWVGVTTDTDVELRGRLVSPEVVELHLGPSAGTYR